MAGRTGRPRASRAKIRHTRTSVRHDEEVSGAVALTDDRSPMYAESDPGPSDPGPGGRFDRQPPQDIAAEQSVLGGMLLSKDAVADVIEALGPDDFYKPAHQAIYDCVLDLYGGEPARPDHGVGGKPPLRPFSLFARFLASLCTSPPNLPSATA